MRNRGQILVTMIVLSFVVVLFITGLVSWAAISRKVSQKIIVREKALQIAEAGNEYYRWHLAHAHEDYQDGQLWCCSNPPCEWCGPYVHNYNDKDGNKIGEFSLKIKPPSTGSAIVTIESTGKVVGETLLKRVVETKLAIPSWTKYAVAANNKMRFGEGTTVYGQIHSNDGIRFDGLAHNIVTSAKTTYDDPDHDGAQEWAVHTHVYPVDPLPPNPWNNRPDVFKAGRQVSVPAIDFAGISGDLFQIKSKAQQNGQYFAHSGALGYRIFLKTNDTFDLYRVTSFMPRPRQSCTANQDGWGTWSIQNQTLISPANRDFPANGLIFVEDNLWVGGQINTARLTIASGRFPENPSTNTSITINNDLFYTTYDGQDVIGLITQKNINIGLYGEDDLQIDAALIAKNGRVGRYYYPQGDNYCGPYALRQKIVLNGMIGTNQRYGFAYTDGTGYQIRNLNYDANLLYGPPPNFPLTSDQYATISWREIY